MRNTGGGGGAAAGGVGGSGLTLRRLLVWSFEPRQRFKTMAVLVDTAKAGGIKGGALASAIHAHSRHGARPCVALAFAFAFAFGSFRLVSFCFVWFCFRLVFVSIFKDVLSSRWVRVR